MPVSHGQGQVSACLGLAVRFGDRLHTCGKCMHVLSPHEKHGNSITAKAKSKIRRDGLKEVPGNLAGCLKFRVYDAPEMPRAFLEESRPQENASKLIS